MSVNSDLQKLHAYPFTRLNALLADARPAAGLAPISLAVGEPQHTPPAFVRQALVDNLDKLNKYPATAGSAELKQAMASWLCRRFTLGEGAIDPVAMVLPVQGTREALFSIAQVLVNRDQAANEQPVVALPTPFYQIYEGAAIMAGAQPVYIPCTAENNELPDYDSVAEDVWQRCQLLYVCSPGNPTGAVCSVEDYKKLLALADEYDFVIASDECYSEIYTGEAPPSLLSACRELGRDNFKRCIVFNSLSKRSNLPGLRSGLVAGDPDIISSYLLYRTYHGSAMPMHHQQASIAAWSDEQHVEENRQRYVEKLRAVTALLKPVMEVELPPGGFCLWPAIDSDDETFARALYSEKAVTVLPGQYLAREIDGVSAGRQRVRIALVYPLQQCLDAAQRIVDFTGS